MYCLCALLHIITYIITCTLHYTHTHYIFIFITFSKFYLTFSHLSKGCIRRFMPKPELVKLSVPTPSEVPGPVADWRNRLAELVVTAAGWPILRLWNVSRGGGVPSGAHLLSGTEKGDVFFVCCARLFKNDINKKTTAKKNDGEFGVVIFLFRIINEGISRISGNER